MINLMQQYTTQHNHTTTYDIIIGPYVTYDIARHYNAMYQRSVTFLSHFSAIMYNTTSSGLLFTNILLPIIIYFLFIDREVLSVNIVIELVSVFFFFFFFLFPPVQTCSINARYSKI